MTDRQSGSCQVCQRACQRKPGWFKPGEVEEVAEFLGVSVERLFKEKLAVDWWEADTPGFVLAPATKDNQPGQEYPSNPSGECVFFVDGQCAIHPVAPFECKSYMHTMNHHECGRLHRDVYESWTGHQDQIKTLLGRDPTA